jgi:hypothetical protein
MGAFIFTIIFGLVYYCVELLPTAFVALICYNWFLLPLGLPPITFWWMLGIIVTMPVIMPYGRSCFYKGMKPLEELWERLKAQFSTNLTILVLAYLVHILM